MKLNGSIVIGGLLWILSSSALALPVISLSASGQLSSQVQGVTQIDFNSGCGYVSCSGDFVIASGNSAGKYAQPLGIDSPFLSVPKPSPTSHSANFELGLAANYFGFYWGSIDAYNIISFYLNKQLVARFSGADLVGQYANGDQLNVNSNRFINFDFGAETFNQVELASSGFAFESDNHAFRAMPLTEPMAALLILVGLVSLALIRSRGSLK